VRSWTFILAFTRFCRSCLCGFRTLRGVPIEGMLSQELNFLERAPLWYFPVVNSPWFKTAYLLQRQYLCNSLEKPAVLCTPDLAALSIHAGWDSQPCTETPP
jgi:hypothetical protein